MERIGSATSHGAGEAIHPCLVCFEDVRVQCSNCLVTTITIELDLSGRRGVCLVLKERELSVTILDPITGNRVTIDTSSRPRR
jgi:hypothetical protein